MYLLLLVLSIIAAILLICVILVQKSKGGGLSSSFAGSNQIMGVRRTNSFIEKLTWSLGGAIAVLAVLSTFFMPNALNMPGTRVQAPAQEVAGGNYDSGEASGQAATPAAAAEAPKAADEKAAAPAANTEAPKAADDKAAAPAADTKAAEAPAAPAK